MSSGSVHFMFVHELYNLLYSFVFVYICAPVCRGNGELFHSDYVERNLFSHFTLVVFYSKYFLTRYRLHTYIRQLSSVSHAVNISGFICAAASRLGNKLSLVHPHPSTRSLVAIVIVWQNTLINTIWEIEQMLG